MKNKKYIKPIVVAIEALPAEMLAGSEFGSGGSGNPSSGRDIMISYEEVDEDIYEGIFD